MKYTTCDGQSITPAAGGAVNLPQTGQTKCYDSSGNEILCAGTGQDGEIQAGVAWPNPRFTPGTGAEADCLIDTLTGLMWPKNGYLPNGTKTWNDAIDYPKTLTLCGYSDWRLPNINELESLVNANESNPATWLTTQGFTGVQSDRYWSSSTSAYNTLNAWYVYMNYGYVFDAPKSNSSTSNNCVWPVRSSGSSGSSIIWQTGQTTSYRAGDDGALKQGVSWPSPRFTDYSTGEVTDNLTGLAWTKDAYAPGPSACSPASTKTWQGALDYVKCLNNEKYLGHNDWRLPNRKELRSLSDYARSDTALPSGHPFTNVRSGSSDYYWLSSTYAGEPFSAWMFSTYYGSLNNGGKTQYRYVWPVRTDTSSMASISLTSGWNLISFPLQSADMSVAKVLSDISNNYIIVWEFTPPSTWKSYDPNDPEFSELKNFTNDKGYWIKMKEDKTLAILGTDPSKTINLASGWNLIGYPRTSETPVGTALQSISDNYTIVWEFTPPSTWKSYDPNDPTYSELKNLIPGKGYWIKTKNAVTWTLP